MASLHNLSEREKRMLEIMQQQKLDPYAMGPEKQVSSDESDSEPDFDDGPPSPDPARLQNTDWCSCKNCVVMTYAYECICCRELLQICTETCVTYDPYYAILCLDPVVLRVAYVDVRLNGEDYGVEDEHRRNPRPANGAVPCYGYAPTGEQRRKK
ncbi:hypothetical protein HPB48_003206 [Haemaphysalis longicornis]|uniref:P2X purinoreceptor 7 intracellular domain-containing protein n=1 Tax=Haemaphysalis longicornis TaxID=44386 RepID=A0A9J6GIC3_HAELO|nr:hypothetical protein HPB48_003206 [Haemaphysalis longicornis]